MRIGLLLTGISHGSKNRDWRRTIKNIQDNLIFPYTRDNNRVDVYFTTYPSETQSLLIDTVSPTACQFLKFFQSSQRTTYIKSLAMLRDEPLDFIIATRFDILFNQTLKSLRIDYGKFNVLFREKDWWDGGYEFATDVLYAFPAKYLEGVIKGIRNLIENPPRQCYDMHGTYKSVKMSIGGENANVAIDGFYYTHDNPFFKLDRHK